jgi:hypothetical protein
MSIPNRDLRHMSQVLFGHRWSQAQDWADSLHALADLCDDDIQALVEPPADCGESGCEPGAPGVGDGDGDGDGDGA